MLVKILNRLFDHRVIVNCEHQPYLLRWYVFRTERIALFIHKFVRSDEDRALHDHPWAFLVIPLWGGYIEHSDRPITDEEFWIKNFLWSGSIFHAIEPMLAPERPSMTDRVDVRRRVWPIISTRYRDTTYRHRVELVDGRPSWSIFFRFTKTREWGFWPKEGFILWNKWWQDKCE